MAIIYSNGWNPARPEEPGLQEDLVAWAREVASENDCFSCGKALSYPAVMWSNHRGYAVWHQECAVSFLLAFSRDVWELERAVRHGYVTEGGAWAPR